MIQLPQILQIILANLSWNCFSFYWSSTLLVTFCSHLNMMVLVACIATECLSPGLLYLTEKTSCCRNSISGMCLSSCSLFV